MIPPVIHPILVHFPIVLLIGCSAAALAYLHWQPRPELRILTWWLLPPGWLFLLLTVITGIIDQGNLPPDAPYRTLLNLHTTSGLILCLLYGDLLYRSWLHRSRQRAAATQKATIPGRLPTTGDFLDQPGRKWPLTAQLLLGIALVIWSGWLGGELVYVWGVNVMG